MKLQFLDSKYAKTNSPNSSAFLILKKKKNGVFYSIYQNGSSLRSNSYIIFPAEAEQVLRILKRNLMTRYSDQEWH